MSDTIADIAALETRLGKTPAAMDFKVVDHLDDGATRWIGAAPVAALSFGDGRTIGITLAGGTAGFARSETPTTLRLDPRDLDDPSLLREGAGFGALFLVPGIGETLRVNGRVTATGPGEIRLEVTECFMHCAKAFIRSGFWEAVPVAEPPPDPRAFIAATRFLFLGTASSRGDADVSPKGDPAGSLVRHDGRNVWLAERPGNRRADSFRNLLSEPRLAAILLVPGASRIALVTGEAEITSREDIREHFAVQGKVPVVATRLAAPHVELRRSGVLERAALWPVRPNTQIDPAAIMTSHVRLSRARGIQAALARGIVSVPGLLKRGLAADYKNNLY